MSGDEIAFAFPSFLSVIDGHLFVSDAGNDRLIRIRLTYHVERVKPLGG